MRRKITVAGLVASLLAAAAIHAGTMWTVQVKSTKIRKEPKFWAGAVKTARAGERLEEAGRQGVWIKVNAGGRTGWVHESAVTTKKVVLSGGGDDVGRDASAREVSLASKGFSAEVEERYREDGGELNYDAVDRVVRVEASDDEIRSFLKEGKLGEWGRGR